MLKLFTFNTTNNHKIIFLLEELGLEYKIIPINLRSKEQFLPAFLKINPLHQVPCLVDEENNLTLTESGAIMLYLAEKTNKFVISNPIQKAKMLKWLFWQNTSLNMVTLNLFYSFLAGEKDQVRIDFQKSKVIEAYKIFDEVIKDKSYVANNEYSLADISLFALFNSSNIYGIEDLSIYKNIAKYVANINQRPAIKNAYAKINAIDWAKTYSTNEELEKIITK